MTLAGIDAPLSQGALIYKQTLEGVHNTPVQRSSVDLGRAIDRLVKGLANLDDRQGWAKGGLTLYNIAKKALGSDKAATRFCQRFHDDLDALKDIAARLKKSGGVVDQATLAKIGKILKRMDGNWDGLGALSKKLGEVGASAILISKRSDLLYELQNRVGAWSEKLDQPVSNFPSSGRGIVA